MTTHTTNASRPATAATVLILAATTLAATGCSALADSTRTVEDQRTFTHHGHHLTIDTTSADLTLTSGQTLTVDRTLHGKAADHGNASWTLHGDTLTLKATCHGISINCGADYHITIPAGTSVTTHGTNGSVHADHLATALDLTTTNGDITATDTRGTLSAHSTNGSIGIRHSRSHNVTAQSTNGNITIDLAAAPHDVTGTTTNGSVTIDVPRTAQHYRLTTDATHHAVHSDLTSDPHATRHITARTANGSINVRGTGS